MVHRPSIFAFCIYTYVSRSFMKQTLSIDVPQRTVENRAIYTGQLSDNSHLRWGSSKPMNRQRRHLSDGKLIEGLRRHQSQLGDETQITPSDRLLHTDAPPGIRLGWYVGFMGVLVLSRYLERMPVCQANGDHTDGTSASVIAGGPDL